MQEHAAHRDCLGARGLQAAWAGHRCRTASIDLARRRARADRARRPDRAVLVSPEHGAGAHVARGAGNRRQPDRDPEPHGWRGCCRHRARLDRRRRDRRHIARPPPHARACQPERDRHLARQARTRRQAGHHGQLRRRPRRARIPQRVPDSLGPAAPTSRWPGARLDRLDHRGNCMATGHSNPAYGRGLEEHRRRRAGHPDHRPGHRDALAARPRRRRLEPWRQRQRKRRSGCDVARERARRGPTGRRGRRPGAHRRGRRRRHRAAQVSARQPAHAAAEQRRRASASPRPAAAGRGGGSATVSSSRCVPRQRCAASPRRPQPASRI